MELKIPEDELGAEEGEKKDKKEKKGKKDNKGKKKDKKGKPSVGVVAVPLSCGDHAACVVPLPATLPREPLQKH